MGRPRPERNGEVSESNLVALPKILHRESSTLLRFAWDDLKRGFVFESVCLRDRFTSKASVAGIDPTNERRLFLTSAFETEIGEQFHVTKRDICKRLCGRAR